jgi:hypothetical protein
LLVNHRITYISEELCNVLIFKYVLFLLLCMFRSVHSVSLCCSVYCLCENVYCTTATGISGHFSTTLTEVFPCFFLSCKANARVFINRKDGARPAFPNFFLLLCMFRSLYSVYCLYVNVYCTNATGCQPNCSYK